MQGMCSIGRMYMHAGKEKWRKVILKSILNPIGWSQDGSMFLFNEMFSQNRSCLILSGEDGSILADLSGLHPLGFSPNSEMYVTERCC